MRKSRGEHPPRPHPCVRGLISSMLSLLPFFPTDKNCAEIYKSGERRDGVYTIKPDNLSAFDVFCDQTTAGGGWTVFQKRLDGSVDFYLNWSDYKHGFGNLSGEFWLGNEKIHRLTSGGNKRLRVDLEDFEGNTSYAEYKTFGVMSENDKYKLILGSYSGMKLFLHVALPKQRTSEGGIRREIINFQENSVHREQNLLGLLLG